MRSSTGRMTSHIWNGKLNSCLKPPTPLKKWVRHLGVLFPTEWKVIKFHGSSHHQPDGMVYNPIKMASLIIITWQLFHNPNDIWCLLEVPTSD
jgi:hypothetical protein